MSLDWINEIIDGVIEYCGSNNIYEIYNTMQISLNRVNIGDCLLQGNDAMYIRSYSDIEMVFIRDDLPPQYERFVLAHELGHALLHVELMTAAYNRKLIAKGKLEIQANYFALKLLNIKIDEDYYSGYTYEQLAKEFYVTESSLRYCY